MLMNNDPSARVFLKTEREARPDVGMGAVGPRAGHVHEPESECDIDADANIDVGERQPDTVRPGLEPFVQKLWVLGFGDYPVDKPNFVDYITLRNERELCLVYSNAAVFS